jgi:hypothetical protein
MKSSIILSIFSTLNWNKEFLTDQEEDALPKPTQNCSGKKIMMHYREVPLAKLKDCKVIFIRIYL